MHQLRSLDEAGHTIGNASIKKCRQAQKSNICSPTRLITREENVQVVEQAQDKCNPRLLAKHMPRLSNAELQQMFGALNGTVTPLFEKVLSYSDVGRVSRLILPKVCAVTYFPYLTETSGIPIDVLDSNGKNWKFQLRYYKNNSGRMYMFENIQGYIKEMALKEDDTVIFGMIDNNKLVIGFKKTLQNFKTTYAEASSS